MAGAGEPSGTHASSTGIGIRHSMWRRLILRWEKVELRLELRSAVKRKFPIDNGHDKELLRLPSVIWLAAEMWERQSVTFLSK